MPTSRISVLIALVALGATVSGRFEWERVEVLGEDGKVLAIDPAAQRELRAMPLGRAPSFALIAP